MTAESPEMYTSGEYLSSNPTWHEEDAPWKAQAIFAMIRKHKLLPKRVAEIGCGSGAVIEQLSMMFKADPDVKTKVDFEGFDISPQAIEICRKREQSGLEFQLADFRAYAGKGFDLVMAIDVFEHVPDYIGFLRDIRDKGEFSIFHIPLDMHVSALLRPGVFTDIRKLVGHLHYFTKETALDTLRTAGYAIVDSGHTRGVLLSPNPRRRMQRRLMSVPRNALFAINQDLAARLLGGYSLLVLARRA